MKKNSKIVCIFAHPDDEAFGPAGTIAKYAQKVEVYIICVTDGNDKTHYTHELSKIRKKEIQTSADILRVKKVFFLDYSDGELCNNIYHKVALDLEKTLRKIKPSVLITFEPRGVTGHIDHIFCTMVTSFVFNKLPFITKLWYFCASSDYAKKMKGYFIYFPPGYEKRQVHKVVDVSPYWNQKIMAIKAHKSQAKDINTALKYLKNLPKEEYFMEIKK